MSAYGCCGAYNEHDPKCIHVRYPAERAAWEKERDQLADRVKELEVEVCKGFSANRTLLEKLILCEAVAEAAEYARSGLAFMHDDHCELCSSPDAKHCGPAKAIEKLGSALKSLREGTKEAGG